jgi:8-oxo-dGTP diphosphatase
LFIPVLAAIIFNDEKQVLIAQRRSPSANAGMWEFPGGKLETSETPEECIIREIKEELNIEVRVIRPYQIVNYAHPDGQNILLMSYLCAHLSGDIQLNEHSRIEWVNPDMLTSYNFLPADEPIVKNLLKDFI